MDDQVPRKRVPKTRDVRKDGNAEAKPPGKRNSAARRRAQKDGNYSTEKVYHVKSDIPVVTDKTGNFLIGIECAPWKFDSWQLLDEEVKGRTVRVSGYHIKYVPNAESVKNPNPCTLVIRVDRMNPALPKDVADLKREKCWLTWISQEKLVHVWPQRSVLYSPKDQAKPQYGPFAKIMLDTRGNPQPHNKTLGRLVVTYDVHADVVQA
jgi:hypothetical protein